MVSVASLLNPVLEDPQPLPSPLSSVRLTPDCSSVSSPPPPKKQKVAKDAAVFSRGKIHGPIRYSPYETYDSKILDELQNLSVYPLGRIAEFRRHIPYNSDKKGFLEKTGRGAFEVFQYIFQLPGDERQYNVMWDYNIGLVRITPFFKCCQYAKTVPAKMLNSNPGLRDICHSITGGALAAQGYWMPFEAAKAVATTFCYSIRYALVPLFGPSFASECIKPGTEGFAQMVINPDIVSRCTLEAKTYRELASEEKFEASRSNTPESKATTNGLWPRHMKSKGRKLNSDSPYGSDTEGDGNYLPSPQSSTDRTPPRSSKPWPWPGTLELPESPADKGRITFKKSYEAHPKSPSVSSSGSEVSPKTVAKSARNEDSKPKDKKHKARHQKQTPRESCSPPSRSPSPITATRETKAAYVLMQLRLADTTWTDTDHAARKRRASS